MASVDYFQKYYEVSEARQASGSITKKDSRTPYDDVFTTVNFIANNFVAFTPTDKEIRKFFEQKGERIEDVLLSEYMDAFKQLILKKIKHSAVSASFMNCYVRYAVSCAS